MPLIEIKKACKDSEALRNKIVEFVSQNKSHSIVKLAAVSQAFSAVLVGYYFESEKCLETLISTMFSSMEADILRAVEAINSKVK